MKTGCGDGEAGAAAPAHGLRVIVFVPFNGEGADTGCETLQTSRQYGLEREVDGLWLAQIRLFIQLFLRTGVPVAGDLRDPPSVARFKVGEYLTKDLRKDGDGDGVHFSEWFTCSSGQVVRGPVGSNAATACN